MSTSSIGSRTLLAIPELAREIIAILIHPVSTASAAVAQHRLYGLVHGLLNHPVGDLKRRTLLELTAAENRAGHLGAVTWVLLQRLAFFFHPDAATDDDDLFMQRYSQLWSGKIIPAETILDNLHTRDPVPIITQLLVAATDKWPPAQTHHHFIVFIWIQYLGPLLMRPAFTVLPHAELIASIRGGLLLLLRRLIFMNAEALKLGRDGENHAKMYKAATVEIIDEYITPALVWRDVLRAFHSFAKCKSETAALPEQSENIHWRRMMWRYRYCRKAHKACKAHIAEIPDLCAAPGCSRRYGLRMCVCATVLYCSKACQSRHWRSSHRHICPRDYMAHGLNNNIDALKAQKHITHVERLLLRLAAREVVCNERSATALGNHRSVLADFSGQQARPPISYGKMDACAPRNSSAGDVRLWVQIRSDRHLILMQVDIMTREMWMNTAGSRRST